MDGEEEKGTQTANVLRSMLPRASQRGVAGCRSIVRRANGPSAAVIDAEALAGAPPLLACLSGACNRNCHFLLAVVSSLETTSSFSIFGCTEMSKPSLKPSRWHTSEPELL